MSIPKFVLRFKDRLKLPIDIENDVEPEIRALGISDGLFYYPDEKLNPAICQGSITHWEHPDDWVYPTGDGPSFKRFADILFPDQADPEQQRLICCKETLHILDSEGSRTSVPDDIAHLIKTIVLPVQFNTATDGIQAEGDRAAIFFAAAILLPMAARDVLMVPYKAGTLPLARIADLAEIPLVAAAWVMSDPWPSFLATLLAHITNGETK